ncbi:MAG: hypothetical protein JNJ78_19205, partial [Anaerolineae bacterium]|nr:hypothetical protein [Anaerolineae bacterium]
MHKSLKILYFLLAARAVLHMSCNGGSFRQIQDELLQLLTGRAMKTMQAEGELVFKTARRLKAFPSGWALIEMSYVVRSG